MRISYSSSRGTVSVSDNGEVLKHQDPATFIYSAVDVQYVFVCKIHEVSSHALPKQEVRTSSYPDVLYSKRLFLT